MKRFLLLVITFLAFTPAPQSAFAGFFGCNDDTHCDFRRWWVDVAGGGNCYVKFQAEKERNFTGYYYSAMSAYIAIAKNPACYRTAQWLMQYDYIRRAAK